MKTICLLLLAASVCLGAEITGGTVTIDDVSRTGARVCYDNPVAFNSMIVYWDNTAYDPVTNGFTRNYTAKRQGYYGDANGFSATRFCAGIGGLKPATAITVCVVVTRNNGDSSLCANSINRGTFTTSAAVVGWPVPPALPIADPFDHTPPTTFGWTWSASSHTDCTTLNAHINDAVNNKAAVATLVEIPMSLSGVCAGATYRAEVRTAPLVIRTEDYSYLPRFGLRVGPVDYPHMPILYANPSGLDGFLGPGASGDSLLWFIGLRLHAGATGTNAQRGIIALDNIRLNSHNKITFDRCEITDPRPQPKITYYALALQGDSNMVIGCFIHNIARYNDSSDGPNAIELQFGQYFTVRNNYIEDSGIAVYLQGSYGETSVAPILDVDIDQNTFRSNPLWMGNDGNPVSGRRHFVEMKTGKRFRVANNDMRYSYLVVNGAGAAIALKSDTSRVSNGTLSEDITIENNLIRDAAMCIYVNGGDQTGYFYARMKRLRINNNVCQSDGYGQRWANIYAANSGSSGIFLAAFGAQGEDWDVTNNTGILHGAWPRVFETTSEGRMSSLRMEGNIFTVHRGSFTSGSSSGPVAIASTQWWAGDHAGSDYASNTVRKSGTEASAHGKAVLDLMVVSDDGSGGLTPQTSYIERDNLFIPGCPEVSPDWGPPHVDRPCLDSATGLLGADLTRYPNDKFYTTGAMWGTRLAGVFPDQTTWRLPVGSPYRSGGASRALSGRDMGAHIDALQPSLGTVRNVYVAGSVMHYTPPAAATCVRRLNGTDSPDTPTPGPRTFSVSGATDPPELFCPGGQRFTCPTAGGFCTLQ